MMQRSAHPAGRPRGWWPPVLVLLAAMVATAGLLLSAPRAGQAQSEATSVHYGAGWNLVAAPSGTELQGTSGVQYSFDGSSQSYTPVNPGEIVAGHAVWAYFNAATTEGYGVTAGNYSRIYAPANTWVLAGDPSSTLTLPISGADAAESYDATQQAYVAVTSLAPGQGAWVLRFTTGYVLVGTPGTDAVTMQAEQVETELIANPTDRGTLDQAAAVGGELLQRRSYDAVQSETDNFRAAAEEGERLQGASALTEMTPVETQATRQVRSDLSQAQEATGSGNNAGADMAVQAAELAATAAQSDGLAVATGQPTATPVPGSAALRYDAVSTPGQLASYGTLVRTGFLGIGLGQKLSDQFWTVGTALLNGTPPPGLRTATPQPTAVPATPVPATPAAATPTPMLTLNVSPGSGAPNTLVDLAGSGFTPGATATVTLCQGVTLGTTTIRSDGTLLGIFSVPILPPGTCVLAVTTPADGTVSTFFTVTAAMPVYTPSPSPSPMPTPAKTPCPPTYRFC